MQHGKDRLQLQQHRLRRRIRGVLTDTQRAGLNGANEMSDLLKQADEERRKQLEAQGL